MNAIVTLDDLHKSYPLDGRPDGLPILKGIQLVIEAGELVAITGQSGSGKSTLLNVLGCLDTPTRGSYRLNGVDVSHLDDEALSHTRNRQLGFIFQSFNLIASLTVLENVELPLFYQRVPGPERRERALAMLGRVGLSHRLEHVPSQLSGGECQRVAIARALVTRPVLLLADEPTGNLDSATGEEIMTLLRQLHRDGCTILVVTHDPEIAASLPRSIHIKDGRIV